MKTIDSVPISAKSAPSVNSRRAVRGDTVGNTEPSQPGMECGAERRNGAERGIRPARYRRSSKANPSSKNRQCSRIRLYQPRIYHPAAYISHFRPEPNFSIIKPSGYIIQPSGYIGHFERCGSTATPVCKRKRLCFIRARWLGTKRTSLTRKEIVAILDKLELLKQGTSQRSAAEQLDIIGLGCFHHTVGISRMNRAPPVLSSSRLYQSLWSGPRVDDVTGFY